MVVVYSIKVDCHVTTFHKTLVWILINWFGIFWWLSRINESDGESAVVKTFIEQWTKSEELKIVSANTCFERLSTSLCTPALQNTDLIFVSSKDIDQFRNDVPIAICAVPKYKSVTMGGQIVANLYSRSSCYCLADWFHDNNLQQFSFPGSLVFSLTRYK